jgi:hypothetical protein
MSINCCYPEDKVKDNTKNEITVGAHRGLSFSIKGQLPLGSLQDERLQEVTIERKARC